MSIKGKLYTRTPWSYKERPVPSAKLNAWDGHIETALERVSQLLSLAWGGGDGVLRTGRGDELRVEESVPPGVSVRVMPGLAFISKNIYALDEIYRTTDITPPSALPRIDVVQARLSDWGISVVRGEEAEAPVPPDTERDCIALAKLHLRPGMASIRTADNGTDGWIEDARAFL